ncbi:hypothetical protein BGZ60DRAFT_569153 [Tricladium varicosporioides]|nr:hypothetical protein BGZ60DRAFT_569153 [Hymenoscyphus varicosporioides]
MVDAQMAASKVNPFILDPEGDRQILVNYNGKIITGLVSSHTLRMASPVWKNFVSPPWTLARDFVAECTVAEEPQEGDTPDQYNDTSTGPAGTLKVSHRKRKREDNEDEDEGNVEIRLENKKTVLDFREDNANALLILLAIAHLKFKFVPQRELNDDQLMSLAVLCEKYQCLSTIGPFLPRWRKSGHAGQVARDRHKGQYISWVFGWEQSFIANTTVILRYIIPGGGGAKPPTLDGYPLDCLTVPGLIGWSTPDDFDEWRLCINSKTLCREHIDD